MFGSNRKSEEDYIRDGKRMYRHLERASENPDGLYRVLQSLREDGYLRDIPEIRALINEAREKGEANVKSHNRNGTSSREDIDKHRRNVTKQQSEMKDFPPSMW